MRFIFLRKLYYNLGFLGTPHLQNLPKKISNPIKTNTQLQIAIQELEKAIQEMRNSMKEPPQFLLPTCLGTKNKRVFNIISNFWFLLLVLLLEVLCGFDRFTKICRFFAATFQ
uniref:Uncharacterized protein n=1 Tax=Phlegmariurus squarrosus TaxID=73615 RepID=H9M867_PHLSQ|nr:hypothetical protein HusqMp87 [Phlegmariurus squarrosus]AEV55774.1 hypothetical protein HusqMp87 [Phlegmariurus squarrosus]